jgi:tRNA pseudouridine38-40 synthase
MVRNIIGTLVWIGLGKLSGDKIPQILAAKSRISSGPNAPAYGLYFLGSDY